MKFLSDILAKAGLTVDGVVTFNNTATGQTPATNDNSTKLATTAFIKNQSYLSANQTITVSGDATGSGTTSIILTLANSGVTAGVYGNASNIPTITVDAKGRITSISTNAVSIITTLAGLSDVTLTSPSANQVLQYDGTRWVNGAAPTTYTLPIATSSILGGIKVGTGLSIDATTGVLSASGGSGGSFNFRTIQEFTATSGQTTFTISGGYVAGYVEVLINGVYLSESLYTATNGSTIVLDDAAATDDIVTVFLYSIYNFGGNIYARNVDTLTATAGQTSFTTSYIPGQIDVYYNGSKLTAAEYTATSGTAIVLAQAAAVGDIVEVVTYLAGAGLNASRTLTINGTTYDLTANRTWTLTTANISEVTNLYYTDARARAAISVTGSGSYNSSTGVITVTGGVTSVNTLTGAVTLTTTNIAEGTNLYYTDARVSTYLTTNSYATQTYVGTQIANLVASAPATLDTLNELASALGNDPSFATTVATSIGTKVPQTRTITINGTAYDLSADRSWTIASGVTSFNTRTGAITAASGDYTTAQVTESGNLYYTDTRVRAAISLTTTGTSGAATYDSATGIFNIPQYQGGVTSFNTRTGAITLSSLDVTTALTYTPVTNARTITINGTSYDLSANRSWTIAPDVSVRTTYAFTATAAQTTFTVTGGYTVGLVDVFINGVKLAAADFTATNGTTVVLGTGTGVGNIVEIVKYVSAFTTAQEALNGTGLVRMSGTTVSYDNATYATESYVTTAVANLVNSAPSTLDTLNELATALGNDANFATTITTSIGTKQAQLNGTGFVKISGTTISYDNSTYLTTASASSTYQTLLTNPVTGTGTATRVAFFDGTNSVTSSSGFYWDNINGRVAIGKNSADARLEVYGSSKGQIRVNGGPSLGAGIDFYTELTGVNRRNWGILTEHSIDGDFGIWRSASAGASPTIQTLSCNKDGEVFVYHYFNIRHADQTVMYFNNTDRVGGAGRLWSILNGNLAAGIFSIKDETAAANRFSIATDGVATTYISALIGIATDASAYMRISENQIWRTGAGALYINNSGTGQVIIATGGGALTLGTDTQVGTNFITTKNAGITGSNTYFGTGQVRIGGGADHVANTVLSVAPGVITFDRPGVAGGALKIHSDGKIGINATTNNGYQLEVQTNATTAGLWVQTGGTTSSYWIADFRSGTNASALQIRADLQSTFGGVVQINPGTTSAFALGVTVDSTFAFGSTNGKRTVVFAHPSTADTGLQFGFDAVDKTGIIAGHATTNGSGLDFYAYDGSSWANRMRMTKTGVLGIGVNPSSSDWGTRSAIMLGGYGTALSSYNGGGGATELLHNAVVTSGFSYKYGITAASTKQYMDGNNIIWFRAPIGTAGAAITYTELMNISSSGLGINTGGNSTLRLTVSEAGSTISGGDITFASQAKGIELYNQNSGTTDNLVGLWLSTGPHKAGIASGRTNAASNWAVDLRFFVHGTEIANLDHTYEKMRLYGDGGLTINGSLTQTGSLSDITLKENLVKIVTPLQKISQISGYTFTWKENAPARQHISNIVEDAGLIAQEVELILPEIVRTNGDGSKALNYNGVVGLLVEAIKELKAEIDDLKSKN